jgi:beta-lactamase domain-containing protein
MYELQQVGPQSYYINCPAKIGIYTRSEREVYLIDSGNDKEAAKKILKIADSKGWSIKGIINTHSNADHIGGNAFIQNKTGCHVFCSGIEADFTRHPVLEPSFLYGGYPCKNLRNKFLMAKESIVSDFSSPEFPKEVEIIPLPGHFFDMVGFRTPDNTVFLADCVSSRATLEKYGVTFIYDVAAYLETLSKIEELKADIFIPFHADPCDNISKLAEISRQKVYDIEQIINAICDTPKTTDDIISEIFRKFGLTMSIEQYVLVGSTVRSYLSWMKDRGVIDFATDNCTLSWKIVK